MEPNYTKREEDEFRREVRGQLTELVFQTKKTNGSVANVKLWQARMAGAIAVISFILVSVALPLAFIFLQNYLAKK